MHSHTGEPRPQLEQLLRTGSFYDLPDLLIREMCIRDSGMTLREYLNERGGKLTSRETVHFISQILKALELSLIHI